ncbi:AraC family transcriptional regulator [Clostridium gelidum]|uniref:AraC family transcriptional regulator n=1 Tax=Clostridium gelidum TaxID=704125 RepID=A0ABM7T347_9CLOT|nr:AraC family transcriptional regulator [Clostridium gelidum]BCZ45273.1 AraC family transcriptional regulator [Clostridium gelidum]
MEDIRYFFNNADGDIEIKKCNNSIHSSKAHFHNEVSIGLIERGGTKTEIGGNTYELNEKTFLLIPPSIPHKCNPYDYKSWNFRMLYISPEWFKSGFNIQSEKIKFDYMKVNQKMFLDLIKLTDNIENKTIDIETESKLLNYISLLIKNDNIELNEDSLENLNLKRRSEIKQYLNENYRKDIMLDDLAKIAHVSKYYLIRKFNECYGLSPHQYITNLRINYAKKLLKNKKGFADMAIESGFYDQSHFIKCFKEYTGVTPMMYKANL